MPMSEELENLNDPYIPARIERRFNWKLFTVSAVAAVVAVAVAVFGWVNTGGYGQQHLQNLSRVEPGPSKLIVQDTCLLGTWCTLVAMPLRSLLLPVFGRKAKKRTAAEGVGKPRTAGCAVGAWYACPASLWYAPLRSVMCFRAKCSKKASRFLLRL